VKERPIIFSAPMVRAILDGRKTQTRRLARHLPAYKHLLPDDQQAAIVAGCPFGEPGDRLWVQETVRWSKTTRDRAIYVADGSPSVITEWPWQRDVLSAIFLPRGASRITLEVTDIRVQRLQEISDDDARAEGVESYTPPHGHISPEQRVPGPGFERCRLGDQPYRLPFADLWDSINGKPRPMLDDDGDPVLDDNGRPRMVASRSWSSNPWVWAITFRRLP
jgi:hypothetical protein